MKKQTKKLTLNKKTISNLTVAEMVNKFGGIVSFTCTETHHCGGQTFRGNTCEYHNTCNGRYTCYTC